MKNEKYAVEKIVQEFYGQSMTEDEGFIAPDFFAMAREIFNLRAERDALRKVDDAMVERALVAWHNSNTSYRHAGEVRPRSAMRTALAAALAVQP